MENCLFCGIVDGKIPAKIVHQDDRSVVIADIHPQAPVHLLVIPRKHITSLDEFQVKDESLLGHLLLLAAQQARERGLPSPGYRTVINTGAGAGQSVFHLHVHLLGGRPFHWPPG
jgi:histidine triad (HIT) family protein